MYGGYQRFKQILLLKPPTCSFLLINILLQLAKMCCVLLLSSQWSFKASCSPAGWRAKLGEALASFLMAPSPSLPWAREQQLDKPSWRLSEGLSPAWVLCWHIAASWAPRC